MPCGMRRPALSTVIQPEYEQCGIPKSTVATTKSSCLNFEVWFTCIEGYQWIDAQY